MTKKTDGVLAADVAQDVEAAVEELAAIRKQTLRLHEAAKREDRDWRYLVADVASLPPLREEAEKIRLDADIETNCGSRVYQAAWATVESLATETVAEIDSVERAIRSAARLRLWKQANE